MQALREEVFQVIGRKTGLFLVNSAETRKQSSSSLGKNSAGFPGNHCCSTQKVRSPPGSLSSPSASMKNHLKYPLKSPATPHNPFQISKEGNCLSLGNSPVVGMDNLPAQPVGPRSFASDSLIVKRLHLIKRGRNNGYILFPQHGMLQRSSRLWRSMPMLTVNGLASCL